tara:strand:+ start:122 stop:649 length:528 start_codon:yes stop_codon:yes gene_type:complete
VVSQLKVNEIIKQSGSSITIGVDGDTVSGPFTNVPAFQVNLGSNPTISNDTYTKVTFATESIDTDSAFASGAFTVPSGKAGTYFFSAALTLDGDSNSNLTSGAFAFYKNGSDAGNGVETIFSSNPVRYTSLASSIKIALVAGDYMEIYAHIKSEDSSGGRVLSGSSFSGQRIIGA